MRKLAEHEDFRINFTLRIDQHARREFAQIIARGKSSPSRIRLDAVRDPRNGRWTCVAIRVVHPPDGTDAVR